VAGRSPEAGSVVTVDARGSVEDVFARVRATLEKRCPELSPVLRYTSDDSPGIRHMNRGLVAGAILGAGLISGGLLIQSGAWREADAATGSARLFDQVMTRVSQDYIDTLSTDEMYRRAASGFVKEIDDPYSVLLTPDRFRRLRERRAAGTRASASSSTCVTGSSP